MTKVKYYNTIVILMFGLINGKKGAQAALEYLMTYGWALILIVAVVSVLVFVMGNQTSTITFSSSDPTKILMQAGGISDGTAQIKLQNITGGNIQITSVSLEGGYSSCSLNTKDGFLISKSESVLVPAGGHIFVECTGVADASGIITIDYTDFAGLARSVNITTTGATTVNVQASVAYYAFNENEGVIAHDSSGGNDGTLNGAGWQTTGCPSRGSCLYFNGSNARVDIGNTPELDLVGELSMSAWIKLDQVLNGSSNAIIKKGSDYQLLSSDSSVKAFCGDSAGGVRTQEHILVYDYTGETSRFLACSVSGTDVKIYANTRSQPIYAMGDSITEGYPIHRTSVGNGIFSKGQNLEWAYPYHLDRLMGSYISSESTSEGYYNLGIAGERCDEMLGRWTSQIPSGVEVLLMCGTNDFRLGYSVDNVKADLLNIYDLANSRNNTLYIMEIIPAVNHKHSAQINELNAWLPSFIAGKTNVSLIRTYDVLADPSDPTTANTVYFYDSSYHPNVEGQRIIAQQIWEQAFNSSVAGISEQLMETTGSWNGIEGSGGSLAIGTGPGGESDFKGTIDEVKIWDKALSAAEVSNEYARSG